MTELERKKLEAEIAYIQAQTAKAFSDSAKTDTEKNNLRKSWQHWVLEGTNVGSAVLLVAGGIAAATTGYQVAEVKKEKLELEINIGKSKLDDLNQQQARVQKTLELTQEKISKLQRSLEKVRTATSVDYALDDAVRRVYDIEDAINRAATANAQINPSLEQFEKPKHKTSDYIVGVQTFGVPEATRKMLNEKLVNEGYSLHDISDSFQTERPDWFSSRPTVLYYTPSALPEAEKLAKVMRKLTGSDFVVTQGQGRGVQKNQRDVTLFVHFLKN